ncbi:MAG: hypothetical protein ACFFDK_01105 [Promethearchaeota archaeon]
MVNFILFIEKIIDYSKKNIDEGNTPLDIYQICCCIREAFCLSYAIRKNNNLYLYFQNENVLIKFEGINLRYLSSDERSQALLLQKALEKANQNKLSQIDQWVKSTPGICIRRFNNPHSFILWLKLMEFKEMVCVSNSISVHEFPFLAHMYDLPPIRKFSELGHLNKYFFIIALNIHGNSLLINFLNSLVQVFPAMLENIILSPLEKIKKVEEKILYINFRIDQQASTNNVIK